MVMYLALRYGVKVYALGAMERSFDKSLLGNLESRNIIPKDLVTFVYGDGCYNLNMTPDFNYQLDGDIVIHNASLADRGDDMAVLGAFVQWMSIGTQLLMSPLRKYALSEDFVEFTPVAMSVEEKRICLERAGSY